MAFDPNKPHALRPLPPPVDLESKAVMAALLRARTEIGELKGYSLALPNPNLLTSPAVFKEAIASSEIENINTTMMDVLQNQLLPEAERRQPDKEVLHYREAVAWGAENLERYAVSTRLILGIKRILVPTGSEGYRRQQNRIVNTATGESVYTPPPAQEVPGLIGGLERYLNADGPSDPLVKCALAHYQFEAIHPFEDGNGRAGRILMVLYLVSAGLLHHPTLFVSGYLLRDRRRYYELLLNVTLRGEWEPFVLFILEGFYRQARETKDLLFRVQEAFLGYKAELRAALPKVYSTELVEKLFAYPVITPKKLSEELPASYPTALKYLKAVRDTGLLRDQKAGIYHLFVNSRLLAALGGGPTEPAEAVSGRRGR